MVQPISKMRTLDIIQQIKSMHPSKYRNSFHVNVFCCNLVTITHIFLNYFIDTGPTTPVLVIQPWRICINICNQPYLYQCLYNHNKTKHNRTLCIFSIFTVLIMQNHFLTQHIEAETRLLPFSRHHFQMYFLELNENVWISIKVPLKFVPKGPN